MVKKAIKRTLKNGHCRVWYVVLCGCVSEFEGLQNKIKYRQYFKEHLDKTREDTGTLSKLNWVEQKMAATLFGKITSSAIQEALQNFSLPDDSTSR